MTAVDIERSEFCVQAPPGDRRWEPRFMINEPIAVRTLGSETDIHGVIDNVSSTGAGIQLPEPIAVDELISI